MATETYRGCPFCGQAVMAAEDGKPDDPAMICTCEAAVKYQKIMKAIGDYCGARCQRQSKEFRICTEEQIDGLRGLAAYICGDVFAGASVTLPDGSVVKIGSKVSRAVNVKREAKVE